MPAQIYQNPEGITEYRDMASSAILLALDPKRGGIVPNFSTWDIQFDHFNYASATALNALGWAGAKGSDAQAVLPVSAGTSVARLETGDTGSGMASDGSSLTRSLNVRPSVGGAYLSARLRIVGSVANVAVNIGFTDVVATTTLEMPITLSGTTLTSNATDAAVFVYDTAATNDYWHCQAVKADTDTALTNTSNAPGIGTWQIFEIYIDTSGAAYFYIDGTLVASVANAVTVGDTTNGNRYTPIICADSRTTTTKLVDIDWIYVASRVLP